MIFAQYLHYSQKNSTNKAYNKPTCKSPTAQGNSLRQKTLFEKFMGHRTA